MILNRVFTSFASKKVSPPTATPISPQSSTSIDDKSNVALINHGKNYLFALNQRASLVQECRDRKDAINQQPLPKPLISRFVERLNRAQKVRKINKDIKRFSNDCIMLIDEYNLLPSDVRRAIEDEKISGDQIQEIPLFDKDLEQHRVRSTNSMDSIETNENEVLAVVHLGDVEPCVFEEQVNEADNDEAHCFNHEIQLEPEIEATIHAQDDDQIETEVDDVPKIENEPYVAENLPVEVGLVPVEGISEPNFDEQLTADSGALLEKIVDTTETGTSQEQEQHSETLPIVDPADISVHGAGEDLFRILKRELDQKFQGYKDAEKETADEESDGDDDWMHGFPEICQTSAVVAQKERIFSVSSAAVFNVMARSDLISRANALTRDAASDNSENDDEWS